MVPTSHHFLKPHWPAPTRVQAWMTTRRGGMSQGSYAGCNLALHVGDDPQAVAWNRAWVQKQLALPQAPCWLDQVHGNRVLTATCWHPGAQADGLVSMACGEVLAILVADCLPILLCHRDGSAIAALHAGWRGLAAGIIERGVMAMGCDPREVMAWVGPGISQTHYRIGAEVASRLAAALPVAGQALRPSDKDHMLADLPQMARLALEVAGVASISMSSCCTAQDATRWFSYRRDGATGRMAALIWLAGAC